MKTNKGIIGLGLIVAIVLGIVVVGGGAYYIGKNKGENKLEVKNPENVLPNNENKKLPVVNSNQSTKVTSGCMLPSITVLNPNEKETYTLGQTINIKWASNCIDANKNVSIGVNKVVTNQDQAVEDMHSIKTTNSGSYKWLISKDMPTGQYEIYVTYTLENGYESVSGKSLNLITINSAPTKAISTVLPEYVGTHSDCGGQPQCWPPVITTSTESYSCSNIGVVPHTEGNEVNVQRVINGKKYCIYSISSGYAGGRGYTYAYTTSNGKGTKLARFGFTYQSCGVWQGDGTSKYSDCKNNQSNFSANLDTLIDNLMFN